MDDPASAPLRVMQAAGEVDQATKNAALNDLLAVLRAKTEFCPWTMVRAPTLLIHDDKDPFVPVFHARQAQSRIRRAQLKLFHLGGHMIWLGSEAKKMHDARVAFLSAHSS
jgi:pimeloyl-ACP methyl ester carboxylesterase